MRARHNDRRCDLRVDRFRKFPCCAVTVAKLPDIDAIEWKQR